MPRAPVLGTTKAVVRRNTDVGFACACSRGVCVRAEVRTRSTKGYAPAARGATSLRHRGMGVPMTRRRWRLGMLGWLENARRSEARSGLEPARVGVCVGFAATARWMGTPAAKRLGGGDERRVSVEGTSSSRYAWIKGETR